MIIRKCDKCGKTCRDAHGSVNNYYIDQAITGTVENFSDLILAQSRKTVTCDLCDSCYQKVISYIFEQERKEVTNND